jgi:hypothetical protein
MRKERKLETKQFFYRDKQEITNIRGGKHILTLLDILYPEYMKSRLASSKYGICVL